jgi:hypothetical protein
LESLKNACVVRLERQSLIMTGVDWNRDGVFARQGWLPAFLIVFGAVAAALVLTGRQIWLADWGIVDDHEIFDFLGTRQHLPFSEIVSTVLDKTEVGSLHERFRPAYYFLRVLETAAWGRNVHLWYAFHAMAFAVFLGAVWWVLFRILGLLPSALCMVPIAFAKFWGGMWGRLGPSEIYAAPAIGLIVLGCYELFFAPTILRRNLGCAALTAGTLFAIGTKETLLPLAALTLFLLGLAVVDRRLTRLSGVIAGAITLLFSSLIVLVVLKQLADAGTDIYGNSISPVARLRATLTSMRPFGAGFIVVAMGTIAVVAGLILRLRKLVSTFEAVAVLGTLCFLLGFFVSQELAYGGSLPSGTRYDFPAMLIPICFVYFIGCVVNLRVREAGKPRLADGLALGFAIAIAAVFWSTGGFGGLANSIDQVEANIVRTRKFSAELAAIVSRARISPAAPIILEAYGPGAYEPVYSLQRYLQSAGLGNPVAVRLHPDRISIDAFYDKLENRLRVLQRDGGKSFVKLMDLPVGAPCVSIGINGEADANCAGFRVRT